MHSHTSPAWNVCKETQKKGFPSAISCATATVQKAKNTHVLTNIQFIKLTTKEAIIQRPTCAELLRLIEELKEIHPNEQKIVSQKGMLFICLACS